MGNEEPLADPYSSPETPSSSVDTSRLGPAFGGSWSAAAGPAVPAVPQPDFLFTENYDQSFRRSWGERLVYHIGGAYIVGLTSGGCVGLVEGLKASQGERQRIRLNAVLNATGRKGPGWGNALGCLAMMFSVFESIAYNVRGTDDLLNPAGAAALTGTIYKITHGPRIAGTWGLGLGAFAAVGSFLSKQVSPRLKFL